MLFPPLQDKFTKLERRILQDEQLLKQLCLELGKDEKRVQMIFKVRRTIQNTKYNSMIELQDWMGSKSGSSIIDVYEDGSMSEDVWNDIASIDSSSSTTTTTASTTATANTALSTSGSGDLLQRYQTILGQFISGREMEALSWRYGLLTQQEEEPQQQPQDHHRRDYEAEAEQDLFGPGGILSQSMGSNTVTSTVTTISAASSNVADKSTMSSSVPSNDVQITTPSSSSSSRSNSNNRVTASISFHSSNNNNNNNPTTQKKTMVLNKGGRWGEAMSFNEVGQQMRVSAEYGRRLCASALKKLTKAVEDGRLDPAMLF